MVQARRIDNEEVEVIKLSNDTNGRKEKEFWDKFRDILRHTNIIRVNDTSELKPSIVPQVVKDFFLRGYSSCFEDHINQSPITAIRMERCDGT